jgi:hypothetical protein
MPFFLISWLGVGALDYRTPFFGARLRTVAAQLSSASDNRVGLLTPLACGRAPQSSPMCLNDLGRRNLSADIGVAVNVEAAYKIAGHSCKQGVKDFQATFCARNMMRGAK